ncbi:hypothetical protein GUJ93_ZPchr2178g2969 [Zizania palustris]|uniref:Uncharacterized protein n=1 Tax=Zizania palustris TaxID=103762 RepID=A0A8J5QSK4_ZIZPA|nr:hypothetical protein GUJ93_ZPchr2178g2969 [Zizania palustris]
MAYIRIEGSAGLGWTTYLVDEIPLGFRTSHRRSHWHRFHLIQFMLALHLLGPPNDSAQGFIVVLIHRLIYALAFAGGGRVKEGRDMKRSDMECFFGAFAFAILDGVGHVALAATTEQARPPTT